jgi:hypothetical protein
LIFMGAVSSDAFEEIERRRGVSPTTGQDCHSAA